MAGRATLINSTLSSIPTYVMQTARVPRSLCDEIDKKSRCFLWGGNEQTRKIHNISWGQILKAKKEGGLGFRTIRETNDALLTKLGWRLLVEKDMLWSQVLRAKYCNNHCDIDMFEPKAEASNTWRGILENTKHLKHGIKTEVGNGNKTLFWYHNWIDTTLSLIHI